MEEYTSLSLIDSQLYMLFWVVQIIFSIWATMGDDVDVHRGEIMNLNLRVK